MSNQLRDELLNSERFYSLKEALSLIEQWRHHYHTVKLHFVARKSTPAPHTFMFQSDRAMQQSQFRW